MPRLKGKQSDRSLAIGLLLILLGIGVVIPLEYFNIIDLVANFGKQQQPTGARPVPSISEPSAGKQQEQTGAQPAPSEPQQSPIANEAIDKIKQIDRSPTSP